MKRLTIYLLCASALILGWNAIMAKSDPPKRKLGPEWTKDKDDEHLYRRKMEIELLRRPNGWDSTGYIVPLETHTVNIMESDENRGVRVRVLQRGRNSPREDSPHGELEVRKDVKGKVYKMRVELHDNIYFDLDGDGMIDAFIDGRGINSIAKIVFEGRFVEVEQNKTTFGGDPPNVKPEVWGIGRRERYILKDSAWKVKQLDLDGDGKIDTFYDNKNGKYIPMIVFEGQFVEVEQHNSTFKYEPNGKPEEWGVGRKVRYLFEGGTWKVKQ